MGHSNQPTRIIIEQERAAFEQWLPHQFANGGARLTGWAVWCAALARNGHSDIVLVSRPAFDAWLAFQIYYANHAWTEFDAWCAAAWWARNAQLGGKTCTAPTTTTTTP